MANKSTGQSFTIKKHGVKLEVEWYNYDYFVHYTEQELNLRYDHSITGFSRCRPFHYTKEWLKLYFDENQLYQSFDETKSFILSQVVLINMIKAKFEVIKKQQEITTANLYEQRRQIRSQLKDGSLSSKEYQKLLKPIKDKLKEIPYSNCKFIRNIIYDLDFTFSETRIILYNYLKDLWDETNK